MPLLLILCTFWFLFADAILCGSRGVKGVGFEDAACFQWNEAVMKNVRATVLFKMTYTKAGVNGGGTGTAFKVLDDKDGYDFYLTVSHNQEAKDDSPPYEAVKYYVVFDFATRICQSPSKKYESNKDSGLGTLDSHFKSSTSECEFIRTDWVKSSAGPKGLSDENDRDAYAIFRIKRATCTFTLSTPTVTLFAGDIYKLKNKAPIYIVGHPKGLSMKVTSTSYGAHQGDGCIVGGLDVMLIEKEFKPHAQDQWGFGLNMQDVNAAYQIKSVVAEQQADKLGVKPNWYIVAMIDAETKTKYLTGVQKDFADITRLLGGLKCTIIFRMKSVQYDQTKLESPVPITYDVDGKLNAQQYHRKLKYRCDTMGGNSGAPVFDAISHAVIGIHSAGDCGEKADELVGGGIGWNVASPLSQDFIRQALDEFEIPWEQNIPAAPVDQYEEFKGTCAKNKWGASTHIVPLERQVYVMFDREAGTWDTPSDGIQSSSRNAQTTAKELFRKRQNRASDHTFAMCQQRCEDETEVPACGGVSWAPLYLGEDKTDSALWTGFCSMHEADPAAVQTSVEGALVADRAASLIPVFTDMDSAEMCQAKCNTFGIACAAVEYSKDKTCRIIHNLLRGAKKCRSSTRETDLYVRTKNPGTIAMVKRTLEPCKDIVGTYNFNSKEITLAQRQCVAYGASTFGFSQHLQIAVEGNTKITDVNSKRTGAIQTNGDLKWDDNQDVWKKDEQKIASSLPVKRTRFYPKATFLVAFSLLLLFLYPTHKKTNDDEYYRLDDEI